MLESYLKSAHEVQQILIDNGKLQKISNIEISIVQELVNLLKPFLECSTSLSGDKYPTIHLVAPWFLTLRRHLQQEESDSAEIRLLKQQGLTCLQEYMKIDSFLWSAYLFNPRFKSLKGAIDEERKDAYDRTKALMLSFAGTAGKDSCDSVRNFVPRGPPIAKKGKFAEFEDSWDEEEADDPEVVVKKEFDSYLGMKKKFDDFDDEGPDVLEFWCGATQFPLLRKVAQRILSIPASQASDERVFSSTGLTLTARRTELSGSTLSNLTFVHKNYDLFFC
ncbi:Zinc finger BED domain-containing protein 1 [Folsomia candida]|uniref:Zinc finger BED domain-containing protein 1 n=1 Tax=Folsomia candida TaxID=158441 RepID=A0A226CWS3_FOLCA|nr:Zinc finger BED domain-containing protein 1 [Folsomia candida]